MRVARSGSAQQYFGLIKGESVNQRADHVIVSGGLSFFVKIGKILPVHVENIRCRGVQLGQIRQDARSSRRHPTGQRVRLMLMQLKRSGSGFYMHLQRIALIGMGYQGQD